MFSSKLRTIFPPFGNDNIANHSFILNKSAVESDSEVGESRPEFELNTCSPKIPTNLLREIRVDTRLRLRVFRF